MQQNYLNETERNFQIVDSNSIKLKYSVNGVYLKDFTISYD